MKLKLSSRYSFGINTFIFIVLFIFSFQYFYLAKDIYPLFIVSKLVFPMVAVCLAFFWISYQVSVREVVPYALHIWIVFLALISISTLVSYFNFDQPIEYGISAQYKLLPMFFYFIVLFVLIKTNATTEQVTNAFLFLGMLCLILYYFINFTIDPKSIYTPESDFVSFDYNKGYRYRLKTIFMAIIGFYFYRKFLKTYKISYLVIVILILSYNIFFSKGRLELIGVLATMGIATLADKPLSYKITLFTLFIAFISISILYVPQFQSILDMEDGSGSVRIESVIKVVRAIQNDFINVILGFGLLNVLYSVNYHSFYGENFFLSDIGWLGIFFEYGLMGIVIFVLFYFKLFSESKTSDRSISEVSILDALRDFILKSLIVSPFIPSIVYNCGIFATILAIFVYFRYYKTADRSSENITNIYR